MLYYLILQSDSQESNMSMSSVMAVGKIPLLEPDGSVWIAMTMIYVRDVLCLMCMSGVIHLCALTNLMEKGMLSWQSIIWTILPAFCQNSHNFTRLLLKCRKLSEFDQNISEIFSLFCKNAVCQITRLISWVKDNN